MPILLLRRKKIIVALAVLLIGAAMSAWLLRERSQEPVHPASSCSAYGGTFDSIGPESIKIFANKDSRAIIIAEAEDSEKLSESLRRGGPTPYIEIKEVLKGSAELNKGDLIPICSNIGYVELPKSGRSVILVFLEGKDGSTWVPTLGYYGVIPEQNGRFRVVGARESKALSIDELRKIVK